MIKKISLTLWIFLGFTAILYSQSEKKTINELDSYLTGQFKNGEPGAAILIARKGQVFYKKGFGLANLELNVPNTTSSVFQIGSITKLFTALGILQLVEKQKMSLQDSIQKFIPDFPAKGYTITIEHLLTHTSGLTEFLNLDHPDSFALRRDFEPIEIIHFFMNEPLDFVPGTKSSYTNSGYFLMGYIIEVVSGVPYKKYVQDSIFKPSEMTQTYYGDNSQVIPYRASSYFKEGENFRNGEYISMTIPHAAGALLSTVEDMFKWHQALYQNKLISRDLLNASTTAYRLEDGTAGDFGYGWFINPVEVQGSHTLLHPGGISGFSSLIMYLPKEEVLVVLLANFKEVKLQEIATNAATLTIGKKLIEEVSVDKGVWETYKGKYQMAADVSRVASIQELEGKLIIKVENSWGAELSPTTNTLFNIKNIKPSATLEFIKDDTGKVTKFVVNQSGLYEWIKIEE